MMDLAHPDAAEEVIRPAERVIQIVPSHIATT
jgi:hypothetical protein